MVNTEYSAKGLGDNRCPYITWKSYVTCFCMGLHEFALGPMRMGGTTLFYYDSKMLNIVQSTCLANEVTTVNSIIPFNLMEARVFSNTIF